MVKLLTSTVLAVFLCLSSGLSLAADQVVIGLTMVKTGFLKTPGEATETAVDIAVSEINASGGINGKQIKLIKYEPLSPKNIKPKKLNKYIRNNTRIHIVTRK